MPRAGGGQGAAGWKRRDRIRGQAWTSRPLTAAAPRSFVFHRIAGRELPVVSRALGAVVWDTEGRRYLDGSGGAVVVNIGHGRDEVAAAMARQAADAAYVHGSHFTSEVLEEYARRLTVHAPGDCRRLYLLSGGSEATETAVKPARAYHLARGETGRYKVIGRSIAYHGNTLVALGLSGRPTLQAPYAPMLAAGPRAASPFCYHCPLEREYPACGVACADDLEAVIAREGAGTVSAFIAEPVLGASAGAAVPPDEYARRVPAACLATLDILEREGLVERAAALGERALARLQDLRAHPQVGDVRGRGLLMAVELVADPKTRRPLPRVERRAETVAARAFDEGLIVYPSAGCATGTEGDVILLAPPLVATDDEVDEM